MPEEIIEENAEEQNEESTESGLPEASEDAANDIADDLVQEEEAFQRSPEEIAAEAAMLAELEASASEDDAIQLTGIGTEATGMQNLDLLMDVSLMITVELGRKEIRFGDVLQLVKGSLVELNKIADEPVDIYVNQSKIAEGEVVVVDDHFGVRITRLISADRLKKFN